MVDENSGSGSIRLCARKKGKPEESPSDNGVKGNHRFKSSVRVELGVFNVAARFEDFMQNLNLPAVAIPADALDSIIKGANRESGQEQPTKWGDIGWRLHLLNQDATERHGAHGLT